jgi:hypothetical protein
VCTPSRVTHARSVCKADGWSLPNAFLGLMRRET